LCFELNLQSGKAGETLISMWMQSRGWAVMPVYEKIANENKGPQVFCATGNLIAPDLFVFNTKKAIWVEAKHKNAFSWHRITQKWVTGIDRRHYNDYLVVSNMSAFPLWLLFLHCGGAAKDSDVSPSGLYGNDIKFLSNNINHESERWGYSGMIYWGINSLIKLADYKNGTIVSPQKEKE
jgi:hypothetical protein